MDRRGYFTVRYGLDEIGLWCHNGFAVVGTEEDSAPSEIRTLRPGIAPHNGAW